jgi:DNA gyrase/topoisomerase IV subunit A
MFVNIFCSNSILEAYKTGRGRVVMRGKTDIETIDVKSKRSAIIIKEVLLCWNSELHFYVHFDIWL